jgi:hypothetical protein
MYLSARRAKTPRERSVGIRPRTFNYYCEPFKMATRDTLTRDVPEDWLPNHLLVIHVLLVFAVLNPLVMPFGLLYFSIERGKGFCKMITTALLMSCFFSCHKESIFACIRKALRRERPDHFDTNHSVLFGWWVYLSLVTETDLTNI